MLAPVVVSPVHRPLTRWSAGRLLATVVGCALAWAAVAGVCLSTGSTGHGLHWPATPELLAERRDPVLIASLVGAALAAAGVAYQAVLRNPLADPYLLGVSSGASLAAYLWRLLPAGAIAVTALGQPVFSVAGALLSVAVVFALSTRRGRLEPVTLLLVGVIVNAVNGAAFLLVDALDTSRSGPAGGAMAFLVGGIQTDLSPGQEWTAAAVVGVGWLVLLGVAGQLNAAATDGAEAASLGVRVHRLRWVALGTASVVTAAAVAVSGPIGFVGLICPHVARRLVGPDPRRSIPLATAGGAILLVIADALSRRLLARGYAETRLPVGVLTGLLGGPFFLVLLWRSRRRSD